MNPEQMRSDEEAKSLAYRVFHLVMENAGAGKKQRHSMEQLAKQVSREFKTHVNRQQMYDQMERALSFGLVNLVPPLSTSLHNEIVAKYKLNRGTIKVVDARADWSSDENRAWAGKEVARVGAERVMNLAKSIWEARPDNERPVVIGVGPGRATAEWARCFSALLRREPDPPQITLVAITSGGDPNHPEFVPSNFFGLFPRDSVKCVGLFGPTLITADNLKELRANPDGMPGFREAHAYRKDVEIVVSSMGDPYDKHDLLTRYLRSSNIEVPTDAEGNFQYRFYNATRPINETGKQMRALTLFDLEDFYEMAHSDHQHVVLLARTCGQCECTRAMALKPLLTSPELKVWKEIIMDVPTARGLLDTKGAR